MIKDEFGWDRKQTLANCERFTTPLLKEKENIILGAEEKIFNLEYKLFMDIREVVKRYIGNLQRIAKVISEVDMLQSFSIVADQNKFVRPQLVSEKCIKFIDCRHPVVEKVMKDKYIANDIIMDNIIYNNELEDDPIGIIKELNMETLLKLIKKIDISNASEVIVKK